jgi:hypothetical protein
MGDPVPHPRLVGGMSAQEPEAKAQLYRSDALRYVAAMLIELRQIAGMAGCNKVVAALDAVYYEAHIELDKGEKPTAS